MLKIWKREWKRERKQLLLRQIAWMMIFVMVYIMYAVGKGWCFRIAEIIFEQPVQLYALLGFPEKLVYGNIRFYILFVVMILNMCVAWSGCMRMMRSVYADERNGSVYTLCNQWYSRRQLILSKYVWVVATCVIGYVLLYALIMVLVYSGTIGQSQKLLNIWMLAGQMGKGIGVIWLLMSLTFLYTIFSKKRKNTDGTGWVAVLTIVSLLLANLYKVRDLFLMLADKKGVQVHGVENMLVWMDKLYWVSPLSWLNPYVEPGNGTVTLQLIIMGGVIVVSVVLGVWLYGRREL